jgi:hypothetical protein
MRTVIATSCGMTWRADAIFLARHDSVLITDDPIACNTVFGKLELVQTAKREYYHWNGKRIAYADLHGIFNQISDKVWARMQAQAASQR